MRARRFSPLPPLEVTRIAAPLTWKIRLFDTVSRCEPVAAEPVTWIPSHPAAKQPEAGAASRFVPMVLLSIVPVRVAAPPNDALIAVVPNGDVIDGSFVRLLSRME
jgi:hypothetical protein